MTAHPLQRLHGVLLLISLGLALALAASWALIPGDVADRHTYPKRDAGLQALARAWQGAPITPCPPQAPPTSACVETGAIQAAMNYLDTTSLQNVERLMNLPPERIPDETALRDPFRLPGCLLVRTPGLAAPAWCKGRNAIARLSQVLPHAETLDAAMQTHLQARGDIAPNRVQTGSTVLAQGPHLQLTLDVARQQKVQDVLACYTGDAAACRRCPECRDDGPSHYEAARARMLGALVVDLASGAILAAPSSHTPCHAARHGGPPAPDCLALPGAPRRNPSSLANHGIMGDYMTASLYKIPALAGSDGPLANDPQALAYAIETSDTEAVLDEMLCKEQDFAPDCIARRLALARQAAAQLGLNAPQDMNAVDPAQAGRVGKWFEPGIDYGVPGAAGFRQDDIRACYQNGHKKRWRGCRGAGFNNTLAELFGQGNARANPPGIAQMWLNLHAASRNAAPPRVHLAAPPGAAPAALPNTGLDSARARALLAGMARVPLQGGTAHSACRQVGAGEIACRQDDAAPIVVAGKTATPLFPHDRLTPQARLERCRQARGHERSYCELAPIKWFAGYAGPRDGGYRIAIVVLTERN
ncbi:MAG: hypothetical protein Q8Q28_01215 [Pseudomonadota bacterium]|nr:hypothetical protein [Pseudomonadota bacterium]